MKKSKTLFLVFVILGLLLFYCIRDIIVDFYTTSSTRYENSSIIQSTPSINDIVSTGNKNHVHLSDDDRRVSNSMSSISSTHSQTSTTSNTDIHRPQQQQQKRNISLIVQLRGELGNHLSILVNAKITKYIIQEQFPNINIQLIGQHQNHPKWKHPYNDLIHCFPSFYNSFQFDGGIYENEFRYIQSLQNSWLNQTEQKKLINVRYEGLGYLQHLLHQQEQEQQIVRTSDSYNHNNNHIPQQPKNCTKYSLPYLIANSNSMSWNEALYNTTYYNIIRNWLQINMSNPQCCSQSIIPYQNEIIYHHRNFMYEMKQFKQKRISKAIYHNHYIEANPYTLSNLIFMNLTTNTNYPIAITSRYRNGIQPYIDALYNVSSYHHHHHHHHHERNIRYIENQTGIQDFCFIIQTQNIIIGKYQSTYIQWASFLSNASINRFYALNLYYNTNNNNNNHHQVNLILTSPNHPIHILETIQQSNRTFISEQYWQPL